MDNTLVSIIVRTKDRPNLLKRALSSIASQTYRPIEVVLVNDGGCDLNLKEIKEILNGTSFQYIRFEKNMGRACSGNVGIENARGNYIGFLDDDDLLYKNHIETLLDVCKHSEAKIVYSSVQSIYYNWIDSENAQFIKLKDSHLYDFDFNPSRLLFENYIPFNALLFSKNIFVDTRFDETIEINEDWDLLISLSRKYNFVFVPTVTAEYSLFPKNEKRHDIAQITEERNKIHKYWFKAVFNKHRHLITGDDWEAFYKGYLIPKHESDLAFLRGLVESEQMRLETEINKHLADKARKDEEIKSIKDEIRQKKEEISQIRDMLSLKEELITKMAKELKEKDEKIVYMSIEPKRKDEHIANISAELQRKDLQISNLNIELNNKIAEFNKKEVEISNLKFKLLESKEQIAFIYAEINRKDEFLKEILNSESWKITYPLRQIGKLCRYFVKVIKYCLRTDIPTILRRAVVEFYHSPLVGSWLRYFPPSVKQKVKAWLLARELIVPTLEITNDSPRVSLIIPVYNHANYLEKCIKSAVEQDYQNLEIILVDDASTDLIVKRLLDRYAENPRVKLLINEKNIGISETQNRAIMNSTGEIIAFLDCDDYLSHDAISRSLKYWDKSTVYLHTARTNVDKNDNVIQRISFEHLPRSNYFLENLERMYATHFKLIRRDAFARVGLFDPRFETAQDYDMLMRIAFHYPSSAFVFAPEFVYFHKIHEDQMSAKRMDRQIENTARIQKEARLRNEISKGKFNKMISIIMLSYGKYEQTYEAIKSISETVRIPFELILFDNGSDNETIDFLKTKVVREFPFVRLILNSINLGPAEGRSKALGFAKGDYFIIFDNDEVAQSRWIEELLVRGEESPDIAAVVPRVYFPDNKLQFSGGGIRYLDKDLIELIRYDVGKSRYDPSTAVFRDCEWIPIGATLFKVNPASYLHRGYQNLFEDAGVSFALRKQGYRLVNAPGALVLHNHFMFRDNFSMKKKYLEDRYNPDGMLRAIASFYVENDLIIYDEYAWKENGIKKLSHEELKKKLLEVHREINNNKILDVHHIF